MHTAHFISSGRGGSAQPLRMQTPWSCELWCMLGSQLSSHPSCGQTNTCENITLPQTSFVGSKDFGPVVFIFYTALLAPFAMFLYGM